MRKGDKKIDNNLRSTLTEVCERGLKEVNGFVWLTHSVNYDKFPENLRVICVFDNNENLASYMAKGNSNILSSLLASAFKDLNIKVKSITNHIEFDSEENCQRQHNGNWRSRLA